MEEMHMWSGENIGERFESREMRQLLIEATFVQAKEDGIRLLEVGEDVWALDEFFHHDVDVTINSDDILIFDSEVSKEYLTLYQNGVLNAEELDDIRRNGLRRPEGEVTE